MPQATNTPPQPPRRGVRIGVPGKLAFEKFAFPEQTDTIYPGPVGPVFSTRQWQRNSDLTDRPAVPANPRSPFSPPTSGEWTGFYLESHMERRGWMHLYLQFNDGSIRGEGTDYVGPWVITGTYSQRDGRAEWVKQYAGKHRVEYRGRLGANGIEGQWNIRQWQSGPFHIWPRQRFDLENAYLEADAKGIPPTILGGTAPAPGDDVV